MKKEIRYYCKQGDPTCVYPKCTCNTVEPDEKKSKGQTLHIASVDCQREQLITFLTNNLHNGLYFTRETAEQAVDKYLSN